MKVIHFPDPFAGQPSYGNEIKNFFLQRTTLSLRKRISQAIEEALHQLCKYFQKYLKLGIKTVKATLKVIALTFTDVKEKVGKAIAYTGLLAIFKVFFTGHSFYLETKRLKKAIKLLDKKGIGFSSIEMLIKPCEFVLGLLSFGNSLHKIVGLSWLSLFTAAAIPLSIVHHCYAFFKSIFDTIVVSLQLSRMPLSAADSRYTDFRIYLEKKVGVTPLEREKIVQRAKKRYRLEFASEKKELEISQFQIKDEIKKNLERLKRRKIRCLKSVLGSKIVTYMHSAKQYLEEEPSQKSKAKLALQDLRNLVQFKLFENVCKSLFSLVEMIMQIVLPLFSVFNQVASLSISFVKTSISIGKNIYCDYGLKKVLSLPEFVN